MLKRRNKKKGDITRQTVLIMSVILPMFILFLLGAYAFFSVQATNYNLNFDAGRYASVSGCYLNPASDPELNQGLNNMGTNGQFSYYNITVNIYGAAGRIGDSNNLVTTAVLSTGRTGGNITVNCIDNSKQGNTIQIITEKNVPAFGGMFPNTAKRVGLYTQEAPGKTGA